MNDCISSSYVDVITRCCTNMLFSNMFMLKLMGNQQSQAFNSYPTHSHHIINIAFHVKLKSPSKLNVCSYDYFIADHVLLFEYCCNPFQSLPFRPRSIFSLWIPRIVWTVWGLSLRIVESPYLLFMRMQVENVMGHFCWDLYISTCFIVDSKVVIFMGFNIAISNILFAKRLLHKQLRCDNQILIYVHIYQPFFFLHHPYDRHYHWLSHKIWKYGVLPPVQNITYVLSYSFRLRSLLYLYKIHMGMCVSSCMRVCHW